MVLVPFLLLVLGGVSAAFHSFQREVAETAAAAGVQAAASATAADPTRPALDAAVQPTLELLRPALLGSTVTVLDGRRCDPLGSIPEGRLQVCTWLDPAVRDARGRPALVGETVRGTPPPLVPLLGNPLPRAIDVSLEVRTVTYQQ